MNIALRRFLHNHGNIAAEGIVETPFLKQSLEKVHADIISRIWRHPHSYRKFPGECENHCLQAEI